MKLVDMDHTRSGRLRRAARFLKPSSLHGTYLQISRPLDSARQPKPPTLVLNEPSRYHFRVLDPRVSAILSTTVAAVTIGRCSHI